MVCQGCIAQWPRLCRLKIRTSWQTEAALAYFVLYYALLPESGGHSPNGVPVFKMRTEDASQCTKVPA
jgi:hypothetical protein